MSTASAVVVSLDSDCGRGCDDRAWLCAAGMLGLGAVTEYQDDPRLVVDIAADKLITQVSAGQKHTCAITTEGELLTWGFPLDGRLGLGEVTSFGPPVELIPPNRRSGHRAESAVPFGVTVPVTVAFFKVNRIRGVVHCAGVVCCAALCV
jgi:hypothetical protein